MKRGRGETEGGRRSYRIPLKGVALDQEGADLWLSVELPRGSYATVLIRELQKPGRS
ncbi:MAG: tRNA pseudouridine(13) synthase TruD [Myxococcaceae bacterium]